MCLLVSRFEPFDRLEQNIWAL